MTEDSSDPERSDLPRFVRDIGVLGSAGSRPRSKIGVLPAFGGVLDVGVEGSGGIPPALNYLALPEIVASGLNPGSGKESSPRTADAAAPSSESRSPDNETDTKVYHVLRSDSDELGEPLGSDIGEPRGDNRSTGEGTSDEGTADRETAGEGTTDGRTTAESDRHRSGSSDGPKSIAGPESDPRSESDQFAEATESTPTVLGGDGDDGGGLTSTVARPPTVLATASIPGRVDGAGGTSGRSSESVPTRPAADDSGRSGADTRTEGDTERRSGSADRSEIVERSPGTHGWNERSTGGRSGGDGTATDSSGRPVRAVNTREAGRSLTVASSRSSDQAPSTGGPSGFIEASAPGGTPNSERPSGSTGRDALFPGRSDDGSGAVTGRGPSSPRLTVLEGATTDDSANGSKAGGTTPRGGRPSRHAGTTDEGPAGPGSPATGSTGTGPIGGPEASSVDRQAVAQFPFPRNLSLEGGGPDTQFLEEVYRELTKKMRNERQRGWY